MLLPLRFSPEKKTAKGLFKVMRGGEAGDGGGGGVPKTRRPDQKSKLSSYQSVTSPRPRLQLVLKPNHNWTALGTCDPAQHGSRLRPPPPALYKQTNLDIPTCEDRRQQSPSLWGIFHIYIISFAQSRFHVISLLPGNCPDRIIKWGRELKC